MSLPREKARGNPKTKHKSGTKFATRQKSLPMKYINSLGPRSRAGLIA